MMHLQLLKYAVYQQEDIRLFCGPLGRISPVAFNELIDMIDKYGDKS